MYFSLVVLCFDPCKILAVLYQCTVFNTLTSQLFLLQRPIYLPASFCEWSPWTTWDIDFAGPHTFYSVIWHQISSKCWRLVFDDLPLDLHLTWRMSGLNSTEAKHDVNSVRNIMPRFKKQFCTRSNRGASHISGVLQGSWKKTLTREVHEMTVQTHHRLR